MDAFDMSQTDKEALTKYGPFSIPVIIRNSKLPHVYTITGQLLVVLPSQFNNVSGSFPLCHPRNYDDGDVSLLTEEEGV